MDARNISAEPQHRDVDTEHPRSGPHAGQNGILSPDLTEAPLAGKHDESNGHSSGEAGAPDSDREDAGMSHALPPADRIDAARGYLVPEPWKKRLVTQTVSAPQQSLLMPAPLKQHIERRYLRR